MFQLPQGRLIKPKTEKNGYILNMKEKREYLPFGRPNFGPKEIRAVTEVLRSGWVGMGSQTILFEKELASYINAPLVSSVNSCTSALFLSLLVHNIKPGDEVIVPSLTWCSTANAALYNGAKPVFCDIDPDTLSVTTESILEKITRKTKAVMVVHFGGYAVDVKELRNALPKRVKIIEDAAHALGSRFNDGSPVGSSGNLTCFSFYANKNLSTGDGGAIALFDEKQNEKLKSLRQHGMSANAWNRFVNPKSILYSNIDNLGYKMNFIDLQAALGRVQLKRQPEFSKTRKNIADLYYTELKNLEPKLKFQKNITDDKHSKHLFVAILPGSKMKISRDAFIEKLRGQNIGAAIHYYPLHYMPLYGYKGKKLVNTERIAKSILTLPISASMTMDDAGYVVDRFTKTFKASLK